MESCKYTAEKKSTVLSLALLIFNESFDKKMTQIDSHDLLLKTLRSQAIVTNDYHLPILSRNEVLELDKFFRNSFYRYYSQYELTMTKYIDLSIYTRDQYGSDFPAVLDLSTGKKVDPHEIPGLSQ